MLPVTKSASMSTEPERSAKGVADLLAAVAMLAGLDARTIDDIAAIATPVSLPAGDALVRQGDPGDALFIITSGELDVVYEPPSGGRQLLAHLGAGDCVGEMALLHQRERSATVIARTPARVMRIDARAFEPVLASHPPLRAHLIAYSARRLPSLRLAASALFVGVDPTVLQQFDRESNWVRIRGGDTLVLQGEAAHDMYVVVHGSLEVLVTGRSGAVRMVDVLGPGASVGEMALLVDEPRSATVRAIRDSELVRIAREDFLRLLDEHPRTAVALSRILVQRLRETTRAPRVTRFARTVALVPATRAGAPRELAPLLANALAATGDSVLRLSSDAVDADLGARVANTPFDDVANGRLLDWLNERESQYRYVVYECDATWTEWTRRCLRQADLVLVVANADDDHRPGEIERALGMTYELVLLHPPATERPSGTARWLDARAPGALKTHHHIRLHRSPDVARLARSISGDSLGLALSGGGARGFAQLGVVRALNELQLDVDVVGGTSMGACMAGLIAMGHDFQTMVERARESFTAFEIVRDLTPPLIALMSGASLGKVTRALFGDVLIEDLWLPYFCVSSNLSRAEVIVHDRGPLWKWTRTSSSVPGIAPPVPHNGDLLVDGGVLNNLPADIMRDRCRGSVIAVDVSASVELRTSLVDDTHMSGWPRLARALNPLDRGDGFPNIVRILTRAATLGSVRDQGATEEVADLYLHPPTDQVDPLDWAAIDDVVETGYRHAYGRIAAWMTSDQRVTATRVAIRRSSTAGEPSRR